MSESLQIRHGDLALDGSHFATVTGGQKLVQDLRCALLTPLGSYPGQPAYGSTLSDGVSTDIIGTLDWQRAATLLQAEIRRIIIDHQRRQLSRNDDDARRFGRPTITADETLLGIKGVRIIKAEDVLIANVTLDTGLGSVITINLPIAE